MNVTITPAALGGIGATTCLFPALTMVLGIAFFVKVALCFFDYRKHGQFEWTGAAILFVCLIFVLLAPNYIWNIVGI